VKIVAGMEPDTVVVTMLEKAQYWNTVKAYAGMVHSTKEEEERQV